jgi:hypothetical protein
MGPEMIAQGYPERLVFNSPIRVGRDDDRVSKSLPDLSSRVSSGESVERRGRSRKPDFGDRSNAPKAGARAEMQAIRVASILPQEPRRWLKASRARL